MKPLFIFQFQDAVAGTEKAHVDQDYRLRLHDSIVDCQQDVSASFRYQQTHAHQFKSIKISTKLYIGNLLLHFQH